MIVSSETELLSQKLRALADYFEADDRLEPCSEIQNEIRACYVAFRNILAGEKVQPLPKVSEIEGCVIASVGHVRIDLCKNTRTIELEIDWLKDFEAKIEPARNDFGSRIATIDYRTGDARVLLRELNLYLGFISKGRVAATALTP
jgi:hypothetical protein